MAEVPRLGMSAWHFGWNPAGFGRLMTGHLYSAPGRPMHDVSRPNEFERSDADPRLIGAIAMGVAVFLLGVPFLVLMSYPDARHLGRVPDNLPQPPPPRLQVAPQVDLDRLHADETKQLSTYGWVDGSKGVTRIPIERAMRLLSERGRPGWPSSGPPSASQPPQ